MEPEGGPIRKIDVGSERIMGHDYYSAHSYLRSDLRSQQTVIIEEMPDGAGTANDPETARFLAISEAIERWAFHQCSRTANLVRKYGFDYDPTTNGMAAFPGMFSSPAKKSAYNEAIERHCLILWWEGFLATTVIADPYRDVRGVKIENPFSEYTVVLLWKFVEDRFYSYGFGIGKTKDDACRRAGIEMHRTMNILYRHYHKLSVVKLEYVNQIQHVFERRILYYSMPDGFMSIINRLERQPNKAKPPKPLEIINSRVIGPWEAYSTVWRVVIQQPTKEFASERTDYFFW